MSSTSRTEILGCTCKEGIESAVMNDPDTYFAIPTHRLRDVTQTVHEYNEHFWKNGHSSKIIVFDAKNPECAKSLLLFVANLQKAFYGFEPDIFQHNLQRIVDDAIASIRSSIELWPTLVEICYFQKTQRSTYASDRQSSAVGEPGMGTPQRIRISIVFQASMRLLGNESSLPK